MISRLRTFLGVVRHEGLLAALELTYLRLGGAIAGEHRVYFSLVHATDRWFDWRTRLDTSGILEQTAIGLDPGAGREYVATTPRAWHRLLGYLPIAPDRYTYVDLGCGKGRTLVLAAQRGFRRVIGVDLSDQMVDIARKNATQVKHPDIEVFSGNAAEYEFPTEPLILFLYNPFWGDVMEQIGRNLDRSLRERRRDVWVVYWRPRFREVFDGLPSLALYRQCDAFYPWYAIYHSRKSVVSG